MSKLILQEREILRGERYETAPEEMPEAANAIRYVMPKEAFGARGTKVTLRNLFSLDGGLTWKDGGSCRFGHTPNKLDPKTGQPIQENLAPWMVSGGRKWGGVKSILHKAEIQVEGSDTRLALEADFGIVDIAPQHHSISIEDVEFNFSSSTDTVTTPSITPAGTDRLLLAMYGNFGSPVDGISDITYGGAGMTPHYDRAFQFFFRQGVEYTVAPSTGGGAVSFTIPTVDLTMGVVALAYSGVDQATPVGSVVTNDAGSGSPTMDANVSSATGDEVVGFFFGDATEITASGGASVQVDQEGANSVCMAALTKAGASSVNIAAAITTIVNGMGLIAFNVKAAAGGGGPTDHDQGLDAVAVGVASMSRRVQRRRTLSASGTGTAALTKLAQRRRTMSATAAGVASLSAYRRLRRSLSATAAGSPTLAGLRRLFRTLSATGEGEASLTGYRRLPRSLSATAHGSPTLGRLRRLARTLGASIAGAVSLARHTVAHRTLGASATGAPTLNPGARTYQQALNALAAGVATLGRRVARLRTLSASAASAVSLAVRRAQGKALTAAALGVASLARVLSYRRTLSAQGAGSPTLSRHGVFHRTLSAVAIFLATIGRGTSTGANPETVRFDGAYTQTVRKTRAYNRTVRFTGSYE